MKFKSELDGAPLQGELERDYKQAVNLGRVRAGEEGLFYPKLGYVACLPYGQLKHLYLRKEEVIARLCCGTADVSPVFVMAVGSDGKTRKTQIRDTEMGKTLLRYVSQRAPGVEIGYHKKTQAQG